MKGLCFAFVKVINLPELDADFLNAFIISGLATSSFSPYIINFGFLKLLNNDNIGEVRHEESLLLIIFALWGGDTFTNFSDTATGPTRIIIFISRSSLKRRTASAPRLIPIIPISFRSACFLKKRIAALESVSLSFKVLFLYTPELSPRPLKFIAKFPIPAIANAGCNNSNLLLEPAFP